jgi:hypothetical protein
MIRKKFLLCDAHAAEIVLNLQSFNETSETLFFFFLPVAERPAQKAEPHKHQQAQRHRNHQHQLDCANVLNDEQAHSSHDKQDVQECKRDDNVWRRALKLALRLRTKTRMRNLFFFLLFIWSTLAARISYSCIMASSRILEEVESAESDLLKPDLLLLLLFFFFFAST